MSPTVDTRNGDSRAGSSSVGGINLVFLRPNLGANGCKVITDVVEAEVFSAETVSGVRELGCKVSLLEVDKVLCSVVVLVATEVFNTHTSVVAVLVREKDVSSIFEGGVLAPLVSMVRGGTFVGVIKEESMDEAKESSTKLNTLNSIEWKINFVHVAPHPPWSPTRGSINT